MARWKNINGVLQKIAGSVRIDQVLNKLSRNAISNKAVSEKFETVDSELSSVDSSIDNIETSIDNIGTVLTDLKTNTDVHRVSPSAAIPLTPGQTNVDLCSVTLEAGRWFIIGYGLIRGNIQLLGNVITILGRNYNTNNTHESLRCYGFAYVPYGSTTTITLRVMDVAYNCTAHPDPNYCGLFAIRLT